MSYNKFFAEDPFGKQAKASKNLKKFIFSRNSWCASSTHNHEEEICGKTHLLLMKKLIMS